MIGGEDMDRTELLSPAEWISHAHSKSVQKKRVLMIRYWVQANGFPGPTEGIKAINCLNCKEESLTAFAALRHSNLCKYLGVLALGHMKDRGG